MNIASAPSSVLSKPSAALPARREVFCLTLPQMGLMLCHLVLSMTDVWTAGNLGAEVQAAIGVVAQIFALLMLVTSLIASGCMTTLSQSLGAGLPLRASRYAGLIVTLSAVMGTVVACLALLFAPLLFTAMRISNDIRPSLSVFFTAYCCQLPFYYMLIMVNSIFRAYKKVVLPLFTLLLMTVANILGDLGFGLGYFALPACGAAGIAWTTFACALLGLSSNLALARRYTLLCKKSFAPWKWNKRAMPYLFKVGLPAAAGQLITQAGSLVNLAIIGLLPESTAMLAGMSVGSRVHALLMFPLGAFNMSLVIFSGYLLGGGKGDALYAFGRRMAAITGLALIPPSLILWLLRAPVTGLFSSEPPVMEQAALFLLFACLSGPFVGMTGILNAFFSGAGATLLSCRVGVLTCWIVGIPLALGLGVALGWGAIGVYAAAMARDICAFLWIVYLFRQKNWLEYGLRKRHTG